MVIGTELPGKEVLAVLDAAISATSGKPRLIICHSIAGLQSHGADIQIFWRYKPRFAHLHDQKGGNGKPWAGRRRLLHPKR